MYGVPSDRTMQATGFCLPLHGSNPAVIACRAAWTEQGAGFVFQLVPVEARDALSWRPWDSKGLVGVIFPHALR